MYRSENTNLNLRYWLYMLCIVVLCLFITGLSIYGQGEEEREKVSLKERIIKGKVIAASTGESLPGVNIILKGTETGTVTDTDGNFKLNVPSDGGTLVFSFVGYLTEEVEIGSNPIIDLAMTEEIETIQEAVIVGYGSMEKTNVTGAISSIKGEEIVKAPVSDIIEALRGQVSGVRISKGWGMPGTGTNFLIRGKNSIGKDSDGINENEPLIVVDGIPTTGGNLSEINTADIASIDILKDAAAASIYGASGANGVILITTKTGTAGKPSVSLNLSTGFTDMVYKPRLFNALEYVQLNVDAAEGAGLDTAVETVIGDPVEWENLQNGNFTDWHDLLLKKGKKRNISISIDGGTDKFRYYINGDLYDEEGIALKSYYKRYSMRVNSDYTPFKWLTIGTKIQVSRSDQDRTVASWPYTAQGNTFDKLYRNSPLGRTHDSLGNLVRTVSGDLLMINPLFQIEESDFDWHNNRYNINPYLLFKITDGITLRINGFTELRNEKRRLFYSSAYTEGQNKIFLEFAENTTFLLDNILNYKKTFSGKHSVDATFVYGFQTYEAYELNTTGTGAPTDLLSYYSISSIPSANTTISHTTVEWGKIYLAGRFGYGYDQRYHLTLTMRRDGSSKFGSDNKYGNFPSVSFAWNAHNESFLAKNPVINLLKYRISYGIMGNDRIPDFQFLSLTTDVSYSFGGTVYTANIPGTFPNESLRWEKSKQFNTGIDFSCLNNRISGSVDYYKTRTTDLLLEELIPSTTGYRSFLSNVGETRNWGIDAGFSLKIIDKDFKWSMNVNWAKDKNEIVRLNSASQDARGKPIDDEANGWFIGQDIDVIFNYDFIGVWQLGEEKEAAAMHPDRIDYGPGDTKIRDVDGNDTINSKDRTFLGSPTPDWYGGLRNTFSFKGFELAVLIEAVQGVTRKNTNIRLFTGRWNEFKTNYWTPRNPTNDFPQPYANRECAFMDAVRMEDASFVSLRNISLQYTLPKPLLKNLPIQNVSLYIRGNNLKYWTDYVKAYSPESHLGDYPPVKTWSLGTKVIF